MVYRRDGSRNVRKIFESCLSGKSVTNRKAVGKKKDTYTYRLLQLRRQESKQSYADKHLRLERLQIRKTTE